MSIDNALESGSKKDAILAKKTIKSFNSRHYLSDCTLSDYLQSGLDPRGFQK